jgi:hypothetical protein
MVIAQAASVTQVMLVVSVSVAQTGRRMALSRTLIAEARARTNVASVLVALMKMTA